MRLRKSCDRSCGNERRSVMSAIIVHILVSCANLAVSFQFVPFKRYGTARYETMLHSAKGFGAASSSGKNKKVKKGRTLKDFLDDTENPNKKKKAVLGTSYRRSEQEDLIGQLTAKAAQTSKRRHARCRSILESLTVHHHVSFSQSR
jgi:hypothetical protein